MTSKRAQQFNTWLDDLVSGIRSGDTNDSSTAVLHETAREFHARAQHGINTAPSSDLPASWEDFMTTHGIAFDDAAPETTSASVWKQRTTSPAGRKQVAPDVYSRDRATWFTRGANLFLTLIVVAGLAAGAWLAADRFSFGGFGQNEPPPSIPFAALGQDDATPEPPVGDPATIATADQCTIEPLTIDQVVAFIYDPYLEQTPLAKDASPTSVEAMETAEAEIQADAFASVDALEGVTTTFHMFEACIEANSYFQVWALLEPTTLRDSILSALPPLMGEEQLRAELADLETNGPGDSTAPSSIYWPLFAGSFVSGSEIPFGRVDRVVDQNIENTWMPTANFLSTGYLSYDPDGNSMYEPRNIYDDDGDGIPDPIVGFDPRMKYQGCSNVIFNWSEARQMWLILSPPVCG